MQSLGSPHKPLRVLVADDDPMSRLLTSKLIEQKGDRVVSVSGGKQALQRAAFEDFDVILLDIHMPDAGGFNVAKQLRESGVTTPIIGLTGNDDVAHSDEWRDAGMDACLIKPVQSGPLEQIVQPLRSPPESAH